MSEYSKLSTIQVHNILFERMEKWAKRFIEIVKERNEFKTTHGEPSLNYHMLNAPTEQLILEIMDEINVQPKKVYVVIHMFQGTLNEVAVHTKEDEARKDYEERIIKTYGELVEEQHGDDEIMLDEAELKP